MLGQVIDDHRQPNAAEKKGKEPESAERVIDARSEFDCYAIDIQCTPIVQHLKSEASSHFADA